MNSVRVGVGGVLQDNKGRLFLLKRKKAPEAGCWSISGGAVEYGETVEEAIIREFGEETGLADCTAWFIGYTELYPAFGKCSLVFFVFCYA